MQFNQNNPLKVLLVEDSIGDAILTQEALSNSAISSEVIIARDGQQAMDMLNKRQGYENSSRPDIILLDLDLPKKSGIQVLREIKLNQTLKEIPVMVYSKSGVSSDIHEAYCFRVDNYIIKPEESGELFDNQQVKIQELIDGMLEYIILNKTSDDYQSIDCSDVMEYITQKISNNGLYLGTEISHDDLPTINQNPVRLMMLFYNMVKISLDFHVLNFRSSKIHLSYKETDSEWVFVITNIEEDIRPKRANIEPFHKLFNKNNHGIENMHMSICQKIINEINGRFWVEDSQEGTVIINYCIPIN